MPIRIPEGAPTILIRRAAFERAGFERQVIDRALTLTDDEFRMERDLIAIGPINDDQAVSALLQALEEAGLAYFDDYFELSGNWPQWLVLHAMTRNS
ncbi:MAG: hypothetical protein IT356_02720 [Gemmatimonadaceae bacterium]|nr:hypothetical protein [Gemmatimonadaceae bacterium]